jgi:hypothetical protein
MHLTLLFVEKILLLLQVSLKRRMQRIFFLTTMDFIATFFPVYNCFFPLMVPNKHVRFSQPKKRTQNQSKTRLL